MPISHTYILAIVLVGSHKTVSGGEKLVKIIKCKKLSCRHGVTDNPPTSCRTPSWPAGGSVVRL